MNCFSSCDWQNKTKLKLTLVLNLWMDTCTHFEHKHYSHYNFQGGTLQILTIPLNSHLRRDNAQFTWKSSMLDEPNCWCITMFQFMPALKWSKNQLIKLFRDFQALYACKNNTAKHYKVTYLKERVMLRGWWISKTMDIMMFWILRVEQPASKRFLCWASTPQQCLFYAVAH